MRSSPRPDPRAFTLLEVAIALAVVAIAAATLAIPIAAQLQLRRADEARRQLEDARDAVLGFVAAHARLPCPATASSRGHEAFAIDGDPANGRCADFHSGYLPAATLGLAPLEPRDSCATPGNRRRTACVTRALGTVNAVPHALTRANGMQQATLAGLGEAPHYLLCAPRAQARVPRGAARRRTSSRAARRSCCSRSAQRARSPAAGGDEARNLDGDAAFVSHEGREGGFDDLVHWGSIHMVIHRLLSAGRLP